ncbi:OmpA family protein [Bacteroidales bacterium OttesenSCG-928-L14]|nr:OmpA family protein [Bacteroidales bacterium OttesenSCG-928-L14]
MKKFLGLLVILMLTLNVSAQESDSLIINASSTNRLSSSDSVSLYNNVSSPDSVTSPDQPVKSLEKGSFLTINGGLGPSGFSYNLKGVNTDGSVHQKLGWNAGIGYSYFFTNWFGLSTGVGISYHNSIGKFSNGFERDNYYNLGMQMDDDSYYGPNEYELRARLFNWQESQQAYFIDVPLMISLKHKFGEKKVFGLFFNAGAKIKIPVIRKDFYVIDNNYDGMLNVSSFYEVYNLEIGAEPDPQTPEHGFGTINNPNEKLGWNGELSIKPSIALVGEAGFLIGLSRRVDLMLGAYIDYGLNNIKKGDDSPLLKAPENYLPNANDNIGNNIAYAGMINSDATNKVSTISYGGKIGLAIKLGRITKPVEETVKDTIYSIIVESQEELVHINTQIDSLITTIVEVKIPLLEGVVLDSKDKTPVTIAVVEITNQNNEMIATTVSDAATGKFSVSLDPGSYIINTTKEGYIFNSDSVTIEKQVVNKVIYLDKIEVDKTVVLNNIHFDFDKATIKPESYMEIEKVVRLLKDNPSVVLELAGHTDNVGSAWYNKNLSQKRAQAVVNELVNQGISADRLTGVGYGLEKPIAPNDTAKGRALNRRTEFKILKF